MELISFEKILPRIYKIIPGLLKSSFHCITGATGSAKSFFTTFMFLLHPYNYCKEHKIPIKIIYFALEESVEKAWIRLQSEMLREKYGLNLTYYQFIKAHPGRDERHDKALKELEPIVMEMKKHIIIVDDVKNPTGMRKKVDELLKPLGEKITGEEFTDDEGNKHSGWSWKYHDPRQIVIIVADHVSLISPEKNQGERLSVHSSMQKYNEYCTDVFIKKYNAICCNVQQQLVSGSKDDGKNDVEPSIAKLANNLELARDYHVIWALFQPERYGMKIYKGIDTSKYNKGFRSLTLLKHRDGFDGDSFPLYFKGTPQFFEIPI